MRAEIDPSVRTGSKWRIIGFRVVEQPDGSISSRTQRGPGGVKIERLLAVIACIKALRIPNYRYWTHTGDISAR